jgi:chromatin remodeling complex protein RSC6
MVISEKETVREILELSDIVMKEHEDDIQIKKLCDSIKKHLKKGTKKRVFRKVENTGLGKPRKLKKPMEFLLERQYASRIEVNSFICQYVKKHALQKDDEKKFFYLDETLAGVLEKNQNDLISFQELQKFLHIVFEVEATV